MENQSNLKSPVFFFYPKILSDSFANQATKQYAFRANLVKNKFSKQAEVTEVRAEVCPLGPTPRCKGELSKQHNCNDRFHVCMRAYANHNLNIRLITYRSDRAQRWANGHTSTPADSKARVISGRLCPLVADMRFLVGFNSLRRKV